MWAPVPYPAICLDLALGTRVCVVRVDAIWHLKHTVRGWVGACADEALCGVTWRQAGNARSVLLDLPLEQPRCVVGDLALSRASVAANCPVCTPCICVQVIPRLQAHTPHFREDLFVFNFG